MMAHRPSLRPAMVMLIALIAMNPRAQTQAATNHATGSISDVASSPVGTVFRFSSGEVPALCDGALGSWFLIRAQDQAMTSMLLAFYLSDRKQALVFGEALTPEGYCHVTAFDPVD